MKYLIILFAAVVFSCDIPPQTTFETPHRFHVKTFNLNDSASLKAYRNLIDNYNFAFPEKDSISKFPWPDPSKGSEPPAEAAVFFEDNNYLVVGTTMGEFGGSINFIDKHSDAAYFLPCTDPVLVDFREGIYYVTEGYCDGSYGRTRILKIKNPTQLIKIQKKELPMTNRKRDSLASINKHVIKKLEAEIVIIDTAQVSGSIFFSFEGKDYLIYTGTTSPWLQFDEMDTTYLGEIRDEDLIAIDTLLPEPTWTSNLGPTLILNHNYYYKYFREGWNGANEKIIDSNGQIFVRNDTIVIGYRNNDKRQKIRPRRR